MFSETGYFDHVSAQLEATVGAQMSGVVSGVSSNAEADQSPPANALDTGLKAAAALGGPADNVGGAAVLPVPGGVIRSFAYDGRGELVREMPPDVYGDAKKYAGEKCFVPFRYRCSQRSSIKI